MLIYTLLMGALLAHADMPKPLSDMQPRLEVNPSECAQPGAPKDFEISEYSNKKADTTTVHGQVLKRGGESYYLMYLKYNSDKGCDQMATEIVGACKVPKTPGPMKYKDCINEDSDDTKSFYNSFIELNKYKYLKPFDLNLPAKAPQVVEKTQVPVVAAPVVKQEIKPRTAVTYRTDNREKDAIVNWKHSNIDMMNYLKKKFGRELPKEKTAIFAQKRICNGDEYAIMYAQTHGDDGSIENKIIGSCSVKAVTGEDLSSYYTAFGTTQAFNKCKDETYAKNTKLQACEAQIRGRIAKGEADPVFTPVVVRPAAVRPVMIKLGETPVRTRGTEVGEDAK